ncbi:MAG: phosphoribosylanthranilate isomerase [Gemmataceae bacterium]|jgi:phosphoribosylanthranilate isomerase|nr:phosphoribosylanthranilate isomerase [Gemmataceae bacterium]
MKIKVCGVRTPAEVALCVDAGVDAIGINFYPKSIRYVEPRAAKTLLQEIPPFVTPVGLFAEIPFRQACAIAYQLGIRVLQYYGDYSQLEEPFPFVVLPVVRVGSSDDLNEIAKLQQIFQTLKAPLTTVLIDSYTKEQLGGSGHRAPWELLKNPPVPMILAGGLTPENVADAIRTVRPVGVDVASGVETQKGIKDPVKVREFVQNARKAFFESTQAKQGL